MYHHIKELGRGSFGRVSLVEHEAYGTVAAKVMDYTNEKDRDFIMREAQVLQHLTTKGCCSDHVVRLHGTENNLDAHQFTLYLEYIPGVDLEDFHVENVEDWLWLARTLIETVTCLHRCGVVHRDLKLDNVLYIPESHTLKVIDFNLACFIDSEVKPPPGAGCSPAFEGTLHYLSPEILDPPTEAKYNDLLRATDYWAVGIMLYQLWFETLPYEYVDDFDDLVEEIRHLTHVTFDDAPVEILNILSALLDVDWKRRLLRVSRLTWS